MSIYRVTWFERQNQNIKSQNNHVCLYQLSNISLTSIFKYFIIYIKYLVLNNNILIEQ